MDREEKTGFGCGRGIHRGGPPPIRSCGEGGTEGGMWPRRAFHDVERKWREFHRVEWKWREFHDVEWKWREFHDVERTVEAFRSKGRVSREGSRGKRREIQGQ